MCGRFAVSGSQLTLMDEFGVSRDACDHPLEPNYNVAPTDEVYAVLARRPKGAPVEAEPVRQLRNLRWGLIPSWSKDAGGAARRINARSETVHAKPAFRAAFAHRRCLLPADGYYEWYVPDAGTGKQPVFIRPRTGRPLALAGLFEFWRDPAVPSGDPAAWLVTCTIITARASDEIAHIHDRMPVAIEPDRWDAWLDPALTDPDAVRGLLEVPAAPRLDVVRVGRAVNDVRNNGPHLLEPLAR